MFPTQAENVDYFIVVELHGTQFTAVLSRWDQGVAVWVCNLSRTCVSPYEAYIAVCEEAEIEVKHVVSIIYPDNVDWC